MQRPTRKTMLGAAALAAAGMVLFAARAQGDPSLTAGVAATSASPVLGWGEWRRTFGVTGPAATQQARPAVEVAAADPDAGIDVVDAHWMALTMWGEARGDGEDGMRAVGHVIENRRRAGAPQGRFVTETVSEAYQFSCWNPGDPNRRAMLDVDRLPADSYDARMWRLARQVAGDILAGRSQDPTGGALFYHTLAVAPAWSDGVPVASRIGRHLFFRTAR
jgi:spore germination cell wall hydrolase CwlJ-like protein